MTLGKYETYLTKVNNIKTKQQRKAIYTELQNEIGTARDPFINSIIKELRTKKF